MHRSFWKEKQKQTKIHTQLCPCDLRAIGFAWLTFICFFSLIGFFFSYLSFFFINLAKHTSRPFYLFTHVSATWLKRLWIGFMHTFMRIWSWLIEYDYSSGNHYCHAVECFTAWLTDVYFQRWSQSNAKFSLKHNHLLDLILQRPTEQDI